MPDASAALDGNGSAADELSHCCAAQILGAALIGRADSKKRGGSREPPPIILDRLKKTYSRRCNRPWWVIDSLARVATKTGYNKILYALVHQNSPLHRHPSDFHAVRCATAARVAGLSALHQRHAQSQLAAAAYADGRGRRMWQQGIREAVGGQD